MSDQWNSNGSYDQNSDERGKDFGAADAGEKFQKIEKLKKVLYAFAALIVVGPFLPFVSIPIIGSMNLVYISQTDQYGDGIIYILFGLGILILNFLNKARFGTVVLSTLSFFMWIYHYSNMKSLSKYIDFGIGAYLLCIATLGSIALSYRIFLLSKRK